MKKSIDGFPKRLICILEFSGRNVDNKERRNYAWSKHLKRLENEANTQNTSSQSIVETSPGNSTVERIEVENVDNMVDLFLREERLFEPQSASTPGGWPYYTVSNKTEISQILTKNIYLFTNILFIIHFLYLVLNLKILGHPQFQSKKYP